MPIAVEPACIDLRKSPWACPDIALIRAGMDMVRVPLEEQSETEQVAAVTPPRKRGFLRFPLKVLLLLTLLVLLAPSLITWTGTAPAVLQKFAPALAGAVHFQGCTLHWWTPVEIRQLTVEDLSGSPVDRQERPLLAVSRISTTQPLWQLARALGAGTEILIEDPELSLRSSAEGSNLLTTLERLAGSDSDGGSSPRLPELRIRIRRGTVEAVHQSGSGPVADESQALSAVLRDLECSLRLQSADQFPALSLTARLEDSAGSADLELHFDPQLDESGRQKLQAGAKKLKLAALRPFLEAVGGGLEAEGEISGGLDARLAGTSLSSGAAGRLMLNGTGIRLRSNSWSEGEWITLGTVTAEGAIALATDGLAIDELSIASDCVTVSGNGELRAAGSTAGNAGQLELVCTASVPELINPLRRTLGLASGVSLSSGQLTVSLKAPGGAAGHWDLSAGTSELQLQNSAGRQLVPSLKLVAAGMLADGAPRLETARLTAPCGSLDCQPQQELWKVAGTLDPQQLWQLLSQFSDLPAPGLKSALKFETLAAVEGSDLQLTGLTVTSADLRCTSSALKIPFGSDSIPSGALELQGTAAAVKTLAAPWHDAWWLSERANVECRFESAVGQPFGLQLKAVPLQVANAPGGVLRAVSSRRLPAPTQPQTGIISEHAFIVDQAELRLSLLPLSTGTDYEITAGHLSLPGLEADLSGSVATKDGFFVRATADTQYDLAVLQSRVFNPNSGVELVGAGTTQLTFSGDPLVYSETTPPDGSKVRFTGDGTVAWQRATFRGVTLGPAEARLTLADYLLESAPIQCSLNNGQAVLTPQFDLWGCRLALGAGSRVEQLQLTREFCEAWLSYVNPLLADAVEVQGALSVRVEQLLWDFNSLKDCHAVGELTIHQAAAAPGGGLTPLLAVLEAARRRDLTAAVAVDTSRFQVGMPLQRIPVRVEQGMVTHQGLQLEAAGYRLATSGSVGLAGQLQLTLDVPLEKVANGGRTARLPIRGTITRPQPDTAALVQTLAADQLQKRLGDKVDRTVNQQLNRLLERF
ncbi:MAG: hypothetical protein ACK57O_22575 [Planctomyces sp.]